MARYTHCLATLLAALITFAAGRAQAVDATCPTTSSSTIEIDGMNTSAQNVVWLGKVTVLGTAYLFAAEKHSGDNDCNGYLMKYHGTSTPLTQLTKASNICFGNGADTVYMFKPPAPFCTNLTLTSWVNFAYNSFGLYRYGEAGVDHMYDGPGSDSLTGGGDGDLLVSTDRSFVDVIYGESGNDSLYVDQNYLGGFSSPSANAMDVFGGENDDFIKNISDRGGLYGSSGNDQLYGRDGDVPLSLHSDPVDCSSGTDSTCESYDDANHNYMDIYVTGCENYTVVGC